ncbi:AAA family ATPase [Solirubrobacter ginsenosidimutans]|uniref:non-specific serine/threonine protein kinase n=1 Tax=Solirubrobacter ginsenosidimutans TaxID=490573 RepID=A0A9X3MM48_9ACTN|nr:ATPase domain-containing protein [Solirubrobacter ginsenosidimutans]MDA0158635.1 AAA family ATPase [Solirubrobacter ginsenosidimutans]
MRIVRTGIEELDLVLGGGLPAGSLVVLAGSPGTGKTILAQQMCFGIATRERRAIYYTTLSEPHDKLIEHVGQFTFFDAGELGTQVEFIDLADLLSGGEEPAGATGEIAAEVVRECFETHPAIVVIDSAKALRDYGDPKSMRKTLYDFASLVAGTGVVLVLVGEYTELEMEELPEFAVADVIIRMAYESREPVDRRWLRTVKLRGARHLEGKHAMRVSNAGIKVYPRLETLPALPSPAVESARIESGLPELDALMGGGLYAADTTALLGPTGCGKTTIALRFVAHGALEDESCLYISFQETPEQLLAKALGFGWDVTDAHDSGRLRIRHVLPEDVNLDALAAVVRAELDDAPVQRVVIDSLTELVLAAGETQRLPAYCRVLTALVSAAGASLMITSETLALGPTLEPLGGLSFLFQNVIMLRYVEIGSELRRAMSILKMRDSAHAKGLIQFDIDGDGPRIMTQLEGVTGALGWSALHADVPARTV